VIDYYEASGFGADHYAKVIKDRGYNYEGHILPPDAEDREWGNKALSRVQTLKSLKIQPVRVLTQQERGSLADGINAARMIIPRCAFDKVKCSIGLDMLRNYQRKWNEERRVYSNTPQHDFSSHGADAFRYLALGLKPYREKVSRKRYAVR
jgi:hypothetical protein